MINFETVKMTNERKMMMKEKVSIENNDFYMFEIFDVKNSTERISTKYYFNDTTSFLSFSETLTFDAEVFLK